MIKIERHISTGSEEVLEKKPLPDKLIQFYQNIGKELQSVDTSKIDEISAMYDRKRPLHYEKYGYKSAKELLLDIPGYGQPKGLANRNMLVFGHTGFRKTSSATTTPLRATSPVFTPRENRQHVDLNNNIVDAIPQPSKQLETLYGQAVNAMAKILYYGGADFYKQTLNGLVKYTDNTQLKSNPNNVYSRFHVEMMMTHFHREACYAKVPNFATVENLVKLTLRKQPFASCLLSDLSGLYIQVAKEIMHSQGNNNSLPPTIDEVTQTAGLLNIRQTLSVMGGIKLSGDRVTLMD